MRISRGAPVGEITAEIRTFGSRTALELGDHRQDVEHQSADRIGGVMHGAAEVEFHLALGELVGDRASVGQRACEAVELGDDFAKPVEELGPLLLR